MNPKVSIVVACYNYGQFVAGCLQSLQGQIFTNFEVIVVDDGSIDDSEEKIRPFLKDHRFRYIKQKNAGQANAKNRGIKEARAFLIAFIDADDKWEANKLAQQIPFFERRKVGVVYSKASYIDSVDKQLSMEGTGHYLQPRRGKVTEYFIYDNFVPFSSAIVRKECFDILGMFDESLAMGIDWDLWLRFSTKYQFDYCDEAFLQYRIGHSGQMSKNLLERFRCADRIVAKFLRDYPDILSNSIIKDANYYSCCLRAYTLSQYGFQYFVNYYLKAIFLFPLRKKAYLSLLKATVKAILPI